MVRLDSVLEEIVGVLRANVSDPLSLRVSRGQNFIFPGYPRYDTTTPRIGVTYIPSPLEALAIGTTLRKHNARFQITILVRETDKIDIDGDGEKEPAEVVADKLADDCIKAIVNNQSSFTTAWKVEVVNQGVLRKDGYYHSILEVEAFLVRGD